MRRFFFTYLKFKFTNANFDDQKHILPFFWGHINLFLKTHVKVPKNRKIVFNDTKNLIFR
jgi:hypothetical protein